MTKLTVKELEALRTADIGRKIRDDGGLVGLVRRNGDSVSVKFCWRYRFQNKVREVSIGTWPSTSLSEIRAQRDKLRAELKDGTSRRDIVAERKAAQELERSRKQAAHESELLRIEAERQEALLRAQQRLDDLAEQQARMTVRQLFDRWEKTELSQRKDKGAETRRCFEKDVFTQLGDVPAAEITRAMIAACLDKIVERGVRVLPRNVLGDLRQMFGFAIKRGFLENDPTSHLKRDDFGKKTERARVLNQEEIRLLSTLISNSGLHKAGVAAVWVMLSTCCRVGEVSSACWSNIDLSAGTWRIPPDNAKNGKEHTVALSEFAKKQFATLKVLATDDLGHLSEWVMPASHKDGPVCRNSLTKMIADRQRGDSSPMTNRSKRTSSLILPRGKWTPHDLRRTGATMMGELGVRPDVIEKCLNHVEQNRLVRIYQRQTLSKEQANAWRLLGDRLDLLTSDSENIVPASFGQAA